MTATTAAPAPTSVAPNRTLRGVARSELKRLIRRSYTGIGAILIVFVSLMGASAVFMAGEEIPENAPLMGEPVDLASADGLVAGFSMSSNLIGIIALSLWAVAAATDYTTGWIRLMVQAEPRRWRLLTGKLITLTSLTIAGTLLATLVTVSLAPALASAAGVSTSAWWGSAFTTIVSGWLDLTLSTLAWGVIGFAIATITRSSVAAIAGGIGYILVFEGLLTRMIEADVTDYLPGAILSAIVSGGTSSTTYGTALLLAAAYSTIAVGITAYVFHRRDITS